MANQQITTKTALCPICDQYALDLAPGRHWDLGNEIICEPCIVNRRKEADAYYKGFNRGMKWMNGQAK